MFRRQQDGVSRRSEWRSRLKRVLFATVMLGHLAALSLLAVELRSTQEEFNDTKREVTALRAQLPEYIDVEQLDLTLGATRQEVAVIGQEVTEVSASIGTAFDYDSINSNIANLDDEVSTLTSDVGSVESTMIALANRLRSVEGNTIDPFSLNQDLGSLDRRLDAIERCFSSSFGC